MDKNVEKLREALRKAEKRLKAAGIEYAPKAGDFSSDRSKAVTVLSEEYRHTIEECFGEPCDDVLGGYDISDEMMDGKFGKELIDDICDHVGTEYFADKVASLTARRKEGKEAESDDDAYNVRPNGILPTMVFISEEDAAIYADDPKDYPDTEEYADDDGNVDYEAYDAAVEAHVAEKYENLKKVYGLGIVKDPEGLVDSIYDFNQETLRQAADLWKMGDEQGQADSEALKGIALAIEPNHILGSRIACENEHGFQTMSAAVREAQIKRFSDYLRSLCGEFGVVEWDESKGKGAHGSTKEAGTHEAKGLSEGYLGQTVEDFFDDCSDASAINRVIVYALDDEEPVYDGEYYDLPESILEAPFLEFGTVGQLIVNVADEGSSDYYDTLDDFLGDANVDDVQVWDSDSEDIAYDGDKDSVDDELGQKSFLSFDGPEYITINLYCDKSELDLDDLEEAKGKKRKKKGIHARTNVGDPKRNAAFFNMAMGASEYAGKGDGCCAGEGAEAAGSVSEAADGKPEFVYVKGKPDAGFHELCDGEGASDCHRIDLNDTFIWRPIKALNLKVEDPKRVYGDEKVFDRFHIYYDLDDEGKAYTSVYYLALAGRDKGFWAIAFDTDKYNMIFIINPAIFEVNEPKSEPKTEGCGKTIARAFKNKGTKKVNEVNDDELRNMPEGTEKRCIGMLNSMIAYDWDRKETAKEFLDRIEGTHTYDYIKKYVDELGKDKVAELMQRQIDDVDRIAYAGTDSDGVGYNSIIWKDAKRESLKPRRLAKVEATGKANEDTKKLKDGKWANVGKDGKADSGTFKTKKEADAQRRAMFANGFGESYEDDVKLAGKAGANRAIDHYIHDLFGIEGVKAMHDYAKTYKEIWDIIEDSDKFDAFKAYLDKRAKSAEGVSEAKKNGSKLDTSGIQYFGTKNQFNYDKQQLRIDHDAKTYEKGMFTHIARRETVSTPELRRIIQRLDDMGYKEVKHGDAKAPEGYFEAWKSHSKAKYFEAWERHSAEKALDKSRSEGQNMDEGGNKVMEKTQKIKEAEKESQGIYAKSLISLWDRYANVFKELED